MEKVKLRLKRFASSTIELPASKSIANRALIIQALSSTNFKILNLSTAKDTVVLKALLDQKDELDELNVGIAGTTFRFLTAFLSLCEGEFILTGEHRMKQRPIKLLVDGLLNLGADISYLEKEGYPPLRIKGKKLTKNEVAISGNISSQYLSALVLIGTKIEGGLTLKLKEELVSKPYLLMTLELMRLFGVEVIESENQIRVEQGGYSGKEFTVESDWSAASYWYSYMGYS